MGWSRKRLDQNGKERYTACYRDARGKTCVAGTFARKKDADQAWKTAEVRLAEAAWGIRGGGGRPSNLRTIKSILSAVFTTALNDQVTFLHPCNGVKTPTVPLVPLTIVTPEQFDAI